MRIYISNSYSPPHREKAPPRNRFGAQTAEAAQHSTAHSFVNRLICRTPGALPQPENGGNMVERAASSFILPPTLNMLLDFWGSRKAGEECLIEYSDV